MSPFEARMGLFLWQVSGRSVLAAETGFRRLDQVQSAAVAGPNRGGGPWS